MARQIRISGPRLKAYREALGLDQKDIAIKVGLSQSWLSRLEGAPIRATRYYTAYALAEALGVEMDRILYEPLEKNAVPDEILEPLLIKCLNALRRMPYAKQGAVATCLWALIETMDRCEVQQLI